VSRRTLRLVVVPAVLFVAVSAVTFTLAQLHPAKAEEEAAPEGRVVIVVGDTDRGRALFAENCATCHGEGGVGGDVGPALAGNEISLEEAQETIVNGRGVMPAGLVEGEELDDVLAYLQTILGR
jgi:mono/diheme cytochrome c family protein